MLQLKITLFSLFFVVLLGICSSPLMAQSPCNIRLSGLVLDEEDHEETLPFAALFIREADLVTTTKEDGSFEFKGLCPNTRYHLEVHFVGHEEFHTDLILTQDSVMEIRMHADEFLLDEIEVIGATVEEHTLEQAVSMGAVELRQGRTQALGKMLEDINGVRSLQSGPSVFKPVIHGLHSNRILIYQNDVRLEGQQWGTEHAPEIDPFQADRVSVLKGAPAVRYGAEAIGGVVVVAPPSLPQEAGWRGEVNLSTQTNGRMGTISGQVERGSNRWHGVGWRLQGTLKRAGDFHTPRYGLPNTGLSEANISGAVGISRKNWKGEIYGSHYSSQNGILRSAHIGNLSDLERAIAADTPFYIQPFTYEISTPRQAINHTLVKADIEFPMTEKGGLDIIFGWQQNHRQEFDRRRGDRSDIPAMDMRLFTNTLDVHYHHPFIPNWKGTVGVAGIWKSNNNVPGTGVSPLIPAYRAGRGSIFALEQYIRDRWELEAGVRYDAQWQQVFYFKQRGQLVTPTYFFNNASVTLGGLYRFSDQMSLRSIVASAWRPPDVSELYSEGLHHGAAALEVGDTTLQPEAALKWLNTFSWIGKKARLELDVYTQRIDNYIYLQPSGETILTIRGAFPLFRYVQTQAQLTGWDLSAQAQLPYGGRWSGQWSVIRARDLDKDGFLFLIPADRLLNRLQWSGGEEGKLQWRAWAEHVWVAQQTRVSVENDFVAPPAGYQLINGGAALGGSRGDQTWEIIAQVQNAANTEYRDYMNRFRYFAAEMGRNVSLTLYYSF